MKHIKSYENNENEFEYYAYLDIELLKSFLNVIKYYNLKYSLHILKSESQIGLFAILKSNEKIREKIKGMNIHTSFNADSVSNIIEKSENVTNLSVSEIKEIFEIFEQSKKYNL